jgi:hypothetical protein
LEPDQPLFGIGAVAGFLKRHPEIAAVNSHIARQAGYWKLVGADRPVSEWIGQAARRAEPEGGAGKTRVGSG